MSTLARALVGGYRDRVREVTDFDLEMIVTALSDQNGYEHRWMLNPMTAEVDFYTSDWGDEELDDESLDEADEPDLIRIEPLPSYVWYHDMVDFAERVDDGEARRRLGRALEGKGAFRRFRDQLHWRHPHLLPDWNAFRNARANRRAVQWLLDHELISEEEGQRYLDDNPDPAVGPEQAAGSGARVLYEPVLLGADGVAVVYRGGAFAMESEARKVLEILRAEGRTEPTSINMVPVYETVEEWQADR